MKEFRASTLTKAAFSLDCPEAQVQVQLVPENVAIAHDALVSGCGRKATYVRTKAGWIMESESGK